MFIVIALLHAVPVFLTAAITRSRGKTTVAAVICGAIGFLGGAGYLLLDLLVVVTAYNWSTWMFKATAAPAYARPAQPVHVPKQVSRAVALPFKAPTLGPGTVRAWLAAAFVAYVVLAWMGRLPHPWS